MVCAGVDVTKLKSESRQSWRLTRALDATVIIDAETVTSLTRGDNVRVERDRCGDVVKDSSTQLELLVRLVFPEEVADAVDIDGTDALVGREAKDMLVLPALLLDMR